MSELHVPKTEKARKRNIDLEVEEPILQQRTADGYLQHPYGGVPAAHSALDEARQSDAKGVAKSLLLSIGWLDRLLSLFIILAMILGVIIGEFAPNAKPNLDARTFKGVPVSLTVPLITMMWPILTAVKYERFPDLFQTRRIWYQLAISLFLNWIIGPFLMLGAAWATLPDLAEYRIGVVMVGLARCIAMVMIWVKIARGDSDTCAIIVIVNSLLQMVLYAPMALWFINVISGDHTFHLDYPKTATAVGIYMGIPLAAGIVTRLSLLYLVGEARLKKFLVYFQPLSLVSLLCVIIVIFASQAKQILHNLGPVFRTIAPLALYFALMWTFTFALIWFLSVRFGKEEWGYQMAVVQAFVAGSNNFELAIAVAVATYGADAKQTLATTIGPLVEVPVLLTLSWIALVIGRRMRWDVAISRQQARRATKEVHRNA